MPQPYGPDDRQGAPADPAQGQSVAAPFDALLHAVQTHDRAALTATLAPDARLSVPPLLIHVEGAADVAATMADVAHSFDYLRYTMRSRYLAPGQVTDEAELSGVHARDLLGAPPTGRASTVVLRVIAAVQGGQVTELAIWPDVAAVRGICDELARHIDQSQAGAAGAMVTALRATIPAGAAKVVQGRARQLPVLPVPESPAPVVLPPVQRSPNRAKGLKVPPTRRARRRRAVIAGTAMLAVSAGIIGWVTQGALHSPRGGPVLTLPDIPGPTSSEPPDPTRSPSPPTPKVAIAGTAGGSLATAPSSTPSISPPPVSIVDDQVEFSADLLFDSGKATLAPRAKARLDSLIRRVLVERRLGDIVVSGYTDDQGPTNYNLLLSRDRAEAVAKALRRGLPGVTITSRGFGEANPKYSNGTRAGMAKNRRVTVKVPSPQGTPR